MLADGTYDVIVIDAMVVGATVVDDDARPGGLHLELAILAGSHKGEVVSMLAAGLGVDEVDALGTPGTLTVRDGEPSVALER